MSRLLNKNNLFQIFKATTKLKILISNIVIKKNLPSQTKHYVHGQINIINIIVSKGNHPPL